MLFDKYKKNELTTTGLINDIFADNDKFYDASTRLNISKVEQQIISIPDKSNDYHGIVTTTITTQNNNSYTGIGEAYSSDQLPREHVLHNAQILAYKNAVCNAVIAGNDFHRRKIINVTPQLQSNSIQNSNQDDTDKTKRKGGGKRPITQKQIDLINNLAEQNNSTGNQEAILLCSKELHELIGEEADHLIKHLQSNTVY